MPAASSVATAAGSASARESGSGASVSSHAWGKSGCGYLRFRGRPREQQGRGGRGRQAPAARRSRGRARRAKAAPSALDRPPKSRKLPPISASTASGGARATAGVNCVAHEATASSAADSASGIALAQHEVGRERERRRDELPGAHSGIARGGVGADDARRASAGGHRERHRGVSGRVPSREDVERQRRQEAGRPRAWRSAGSESVHRAEGSPRGSPQIAASESPSSASSAARRCASFAQKNSSSCGGLTGVPASIACAWPR